MTVASGTSPFTPFAPKKFQETKSPAEFLKPKLSALPSLAHLPFCGVFVDLAQAMLPSMPEAVLYGLALWS